MNKQKTLWGAFASAVKETPRGFFKPAIAAFSSVVEPFPLSSRRPRAAVASQIDPKNRKR